MYILVRFNVIIKKILKQQTLSLTSLYAVQIYIEIVNSKICLQNEQKTIFGAKSEFFGVQSKPALGFLFNMPPL